MLPLSTSNLWRICKRAKGRDEVERKGRTSRELTLARQAVEEHPQSTRKRQKLAELLAKAGQREEAVSEYMALAALWSAQDELPKAAATYKQLLRVSPGDRDAHYKLSACYEVLEKRADASEQLQNYARICEANGSFDEAIEALERAEKIHRLRVPMLVRLANMVHTAGQRDVAIRIYEDALEQLETRAYWSDYKKVAAQLLALAPEHLATHKSLIQLALEQGQLDHAQTLLKQAYVYGSKDPELLEMWALVHKQLSQEEAALGVLKELAEVYEEAGEVPQARATLSRILTRQPEHEEAKEALAQLSATMPSQVYETQRELPSLEGPALRETTLHTEALTEAFDVDDTPVSPIHLPQMDEPQETLIEEDPVSSPLDKATEPIVLPPALVESEGDFGGGEAPPIPLVIPEEAPKEPTQPVFEEQVGVSLPVECLSLPRHVRGDLSGWLERIEKIEWFSGKGHPQTGIEHLREHIRRLQPTSDYPLHPRLSYVRTSWSLLEQQIASQEEIDEVVGQAARMILRDDPSELDRAGQVAWFALEQYLFTQSRFVPFAMANDAVSEIGWSVAQVSDWVIADARCKTEAKGVAQRHGRYYAWSAAKAAAWRSAWPAIRAASEGHTSPLLEQAARPATRDASWHATWLTLSDLIPPDKDPYAPLAAIWELGLYPMLLHNHDYLLIVIDESYQGPFKVIHTREDRLP